MWFSIDKTDEWFLVEAVKCESAPHSESDPIFNVSNLEHIDMPVHINVVEKRKKKIRNRAVCKVEHINVCSIVYIWLCDNGNKNPTKHMGKQKWLRTTPKKGWILQVFLLEPWFNSLFSDFVERIYFYDVALMKKKEQTKQIKR